MSTHANLFKIKAQSPKTIMQKVASYTEQQGKELTKLPVLQVHLYGQSFRSVLVEITKEHGTEVFSLMVVDAHGVPTGETVFANFQNIVAVSVLNSNQFLPLLTNGEVARAPSNEPAPTSLGLKRKMEQLSTQVSTSTGLRLAFEVDQAIEKSKDNPDAMRNIDDVAMALPEIVTAISAEQIGKEALNALARISLIQAQNGPGIRSSRKENTILLELDFTRALPSDLKAEIRKALETSL